MKIMTENYVIEFMSNEWIRNTIFSILYIIVVLFIGKLLNYKDRIVLAKIIAVLLIILLGTYFLMNIRASKKQTDRKNRIKWRF